jgi:O-antigen ligase
MEPLSSSNETIAKPSHLNWITGYGWMLAVSFVLAQPFHHLFELPILLMALLGLWLLLSHTRNVWAMPAVKPLLIVFACIWLPMLFSLTDAVNLSRSAQTTLVFLRYPLAGIFLIYALQDAISRKRLLRTTGVAISLGVLVMVILAITGHAYEGRVMGIPFPIAQLLGALSPILFFWVLSEAQRKRWMWLILPLASSAMLFSGSRSSWIMFAVAFFLFLAQLLFLEKSILNWKSGLVALLLLGIGVSFAIHAPTMKERIAQTAGLFSGNYAKANAATSLRLPIWTVAVHVAKDHWINGVGPRGFRYIYSQYVPKDDYWIAQTMTDKSGKVIHPGLGPNHPHQFLLEVAAETGVIGLLGYLIALIYWGRLAIQAIHKKTYDALAWMAAAFVAVMPINAHMALYASFWSCLVWWLVATALAYWQAGQKST